MVAGVYLIVNKKTGQKYAGGSKDIEKRIKEHINSPYKGSYIDNAIQKHGFDSFDWQIIEELPADWEIIGEREKYWINFYNTFENPEHYNLTKGGEGMSGWTHSEETKDKISKSMIGGKHTEKTKQKISKSMIGKERTRETKNKTGFYRVSKKNNSSSNSQPIFMYRFYDENNNRKSINSISLEKLEKRVKNKGLPWKILDEEKALKTLNEVSS